MFEHCAPGELPDSTNGSHSVERSAYIAEVGYFAVGAGATRQLATASVRLSHASA